LAEPSWHKIQKYDFEWRGTKYSTIFARCPTGGIFKLILLKIKFNLRILPMPLNHRITKSKLKRR